MIRHETSIHLNCSPAEVFAFLAEPQNLLRWQSNVISAESLSEGPLHADSRFREVRKLGGRSSEVRSELTAFEPGRRLATRTLGAPKVTVSYRLDAEGSGTRLGYELVMHPTGMMRLMEPVIRSSIRKDTQADFNKLKQILESPPTTNK